MVISMGVKATKIKAKITNNSMQITKMEHKLQKWI